MRSSSISTVPNGHAAAVLRSGIRSATSRTSRRITVHLGRYYGYRHVVASDASLVIEGSEITCPAQRAWQARHLDYEGRLIAFFIGRRLGYALPHP
jgi:hypothetical protein